jgi:hypothetical protein
MGAARRRRRWTSRDHEWALLLPWELVFLPLLLLPLGLAVAAIAALALLVVWLIVRAYSSRS